MKKKCVAMMLIAIMTASLAGCGSSKDGSGKSVKLDSDHPVSLTIWHYYNGAQQAMFDTLVKEFNASVGKEEGVYVESYSQGSVSDLEEAVNSSLNGEVGAEELPDIFSSYSDTAYAVQQQDKLADLSVYFTEDELSRYVDSYIQEGYFNQDGALYLFPVAKSTEITMINKTDWEPFAEATGTTVEELATTEGITEAAQRYYEWTDEQTPDVPDDGKAFYGRDSMSNYFIIGMKQMGKEIFQVKDGKMTLNTDEDLIRRTAEDHDLMITVDNHSIVGGLGEAVSQAVAPGKAVPVIRLGIQDVFCEGMTQEQLADRHGISSGRIFDTVMKIYEDLPERKTGK